MSYVYALIDETGDYIDFAYFQKDQAEFAAMELQIDAIWAGIDCEISLKVVRAKDLPNSVEIY